MAVFLLTEPSSHERALELPWSRVDAAMVAGAALATAVAMSQLWRPGVPNAIGFMCGVYRAFELATSLEGGLLYPRLGMGLNFTYGALLFEFYAPLVSYFAVSLHWMELGFVDAEKGVFMVARLVGAVGAYASVRWFSCYRLPAVESSFCWQA
jgi:hypothetical protein